MNINNTSLDESIVSSYACSCIRHKLTTSDAETNYFGVTIMDKIIVDEVDGMSISVYHLQYNRDLDVTSIALNIVSYYL